MGQGYRSPIPKLLGPYTEDISAFSHPWCQTIMSDPTFTRYNVRFRDHETPGFDSFFSRILWTPDTIRGCLGFYTKSAMDQASSQDCGKELKVQDFGEARMLVSLSTGINGIPGVLHGGLIAFLLDEITNVPVCSQDGGYFVTGELKVRHLKPVPTPGVVLCRSWIEAEGNERIHKGKRIKAMGAVEDGMGGIFTRGEAVFVRLKEKL
jgi:acyl-coenzyme A thioesterase PaaI-like protein